MNIKKPLAWAGRIVGGLLVLVVVAYGTIHLLSVRRANAAVMVPTHFASAVDLADSALIAEGARLAQVRGCVECHNANLGGKLFINEPVIGVIYAPNLTRGDGARGAEMTPEDWELAVRHGVRRDGRKLAVMPSPEFAELTDHDLSAIIAYARSVEPVASDPMPLPKLGPMGRALYLAGQLPAYPADDMEHRTTHEATITPEVSVEFGRYIVRSCTGCHGPNYSGGKIPGMPPTAPAAANLTPDSTGIGSWTEADFILALREGVRPDGRKLDQQFMPVPLTKQMTDTELKAAFMYLRTVPAARHGAR